MNSSDSTDGNCIGRSKEKSCNDSSSSQTKGRGPAGKAVMSVGKYARYYKMDHKKRGLAYIFNHKEFKECDERHGTHVDAEKLKKCLGDLHFDYFVFNDLKLQEIRNHINMAADMDHTNYDCFLLVVLSHGHLDSLYAYDEKYSPFEVIFNKFTAEYCPTLAGKPKIFILQSCQGNNLDPGILLVNRTEFDGQQYPYTIPVSADFLIIYASSKGQYAFRSETRGSYFITILCEELQNLASEENILNILTIVNQRVAVEFESFNEDNLACHKKKQMPYFQSSLTRFLHFGKVDIPIVDEEEIISIRSNKK